MSCKESLPVLPNYIAYYLFAKLRVDFKPARICSCLSKKQFILILNRVSTTKTRKQLIRRYDLAVFLSFSFSTMT